MGSEARARLGLFGLVTATLLTFNQLFEQQDFAGPSLLGMMAALGATLVARRFGLWPSTTIFVSLACLVAYLCLIFQAPKTFYGLPTIAALRGLTRSISLAQGHSSVDFAPVPLRAGYAVLTTAAMWMLVTWGEVAAFRWRRPVLATLPALGLFAFVQVVGTHQASAFYVVLLLATLLTFWALDASHRMRSWGRSVAAFRKRHVNQPPPVTSGLARRMGASCVAAALVLPVFLPAIEEGLVSWRTKNGEGGFGGSGGGSTGGRIDPLVSLVPQLINQTERELFRVRSDRPEYWRLLTLTRFDGESWKRGSVGQIAIDDDGGTPFESDAPGQLVRQEFTITDLEGHELPLAGLPLRIVAAPDLDGRLSIDPATTDLTLDGTITQGASYAVEATVPRASFQDLLEAEVAAPPTPQYVETPKLSKPVRDLAASWTRGADTDIEKLAQIQSRLRAFDYSIELEKPTSSDYLEEFLLDTRIGYCQQFATAFAVLARNLGFPTRVVVGFLPGETDIATPENYVVTGNETHAWPEVLFQGYGWIRFEPTPRQEASAPVYTVGGGSEPATISGAEAPTGAAGGGRDIDGVNPAANNRALQDAGGPNDGRRRRTRPDAIDTHWQKTFGRIALALALAALLFIGLVPALKQARTRARYARARGPRGRAAAAFRDFEEAAASLASPRASAESASRFAGRVAADARLPERHAARLASIYEAAEYAPAELSPQVAEEAHRLADVLKTRLWAQAGWWRRIKRLWSPAGLIPHPPVRVRRAALQKILSLSRS